MTWYDDGGNTPPHEPPSQAQVEAKADEMFGSGWKRVFEEVRGDADAAIARRLDQARNAIMAERRAEWKARG